VRYPLSDPERASISAIDILSSKIAILIAPCPCQITVSIQGFVGYIYIYHIMLVFCLMTKKDGDDGKKKYLVEKKRCLMEEIGMKTQNKILYF